MNTMLKRRQAVETVADSRHLPQDFKNAYVRLRHAKGINTKEDRNGLFRKGVVAS